MKTFALAAIAAAATAVEMTSDDFQFIHYIAEHNKAYTTTEEFNFRKQVWSEKHGEINAHNADETQTHKLAHNKFSDWTPEEFKVLLGYKPELRTSDVAKEPVEYEPTNSEGIDWTTKGAVTDVKDQGACGSCWSFSTTGALEGAHQIKTGNLVSYSEMQFVNCDYGLTKNLGCNGGLMDKAFKYAETNAITTEEAYPYVPKKGTCDETMLVDAELLVSTYVDVKTGDKEALKAQLEKGPVSVAIEADKSVFQSYKSGVITGTTCGTNLDHGVLAVGWGVENGVEYFKVKNSWGPSWGDNGYVKIGSDNVCGILDGPPSQPSTN